MVKISVDETLCIGCGLCVSNCPEVFEMNDDSTARVKVQAGEGVKVLGIAGSSRRKY